MLAQARTRGLGMTKNSCKSSSKLTLFFRWSLAASMALIGTLDLSSSASALTSFVSGSYQLGGFFPVSQQDPVAIDNSPSAITTDSVGNNITELVTQSAAAGILRSTAQSIVITGQSGQPGAGFATSTVGFTDFLTIQSVSNPVGTPVTIHLQMFLEGILGANGTTINQTGNNDYSRANVNASITVPQIFGPGTVLPGPTSTTGTVNSGGSQSFPVAFTNLFINTLVGVTFELDGLLQTTAFANTFGGSLCCQLPQFITPTYPSANSAASYENTAIFSIVSISDGDFITSASGATYSGVGTPLPAALPLFAAGLGGLGLLGWWRKRKSVAA